MAYEAQMTPADKAAAEREEGSGGEPKVPQIVLVLIGLPYIVGPPFIDALLLHGGISALNAAYRKPPVSSEQLLDPSRYFLGDAPVHVATPHSDGVTVSHSDLGQIGLLLTLEHGLDRTTAQEAASGWGGDQYVTWRAGARRWCTRDTVVMDDAAATARLDSALRQWAAASQGRGHVEATGGHTTFVSCST